MGNKEGGFIDRNEFVVYTAIVIIAGLIASILLSIFGWEHSGTIIMSSLAGTVAAALCCLASPAIFVVYLFYKLTRRRDNEPVEDE
jgi:uncharacterized membrane protein